MQWFEWYFVALTTINILAVPFWCIYRMHNREELYTPRKAMITLAVRWLLSIPLVFLILRLLNYS